MNTIDAIKIIARYLIVKGYNCLSGLHSIIIMVAVGLISL